MNNIETKTTISGYTHPEIVNSTRNRIYKTFSGGSKYKKNESFGTNSVVDEYSKNVSSSSDSDIKCPVCDNVAIHTCSCVNSDKKCENGHTWYTDRLGKDVVGDPHSKN